AREHHLDDTHRLVVGDAQASAKNALDANAIEHLIDLRTPSMNDHDADPDVTEEANVPGKTLLQAFFDHGVSAVLDDERAAVKSSDIGKRLVQDGCCANGFVHGAAG